MSYVGTNKLGIGTGFGVIADIPEYTITGSVVRRGGRRALGGSRAKDQQAARSLGACCAECAGGKSSLGAVTGALDRLGVTLRPKVGGQQALPDPLPGAGSGGGISPLVKLVLVAGVGVGGFLLVRKLRARAAKKA